MNKLTEIEKISSSKNRNLKKLLSFSSDLDNEVRFRALEVIGASEPTEESIGRVLACLSDDDPLVRCEAVEILGDWNVKSNRSDLLSLINDEEGYVRGAVYLALIQLDDEANISRLQDNYTFVEGIEKVSLAVAIYMKLDEMFLDDTLLLLDDDDYRVRCRVINLLCEFHRESDVPKLLEAFRELLTRENTRAVTTSLESAIEHLESGARNLEK